MQFYANVCHATKIDWHTLRYNYSLLQMLTMIEAYNALYKKSEEEAKLPSYRQKFRQTKQILEKAQQKHENKGILRKKIK